MILDVLAWSILLSLWIFGAPCALEGGWAEYKRSLYVWIIINAFSVVILAAFIACWWALARVWG